MTVPGKGGKPLRYQPDDFEKKIVEYFQAVDEENTKRKKQRFTGEKLKPYTLSGICVYLDITRETWSEYSRRPEFAEAIKRARTIVENYVEEGLLNGSINAIGGIFNLKNNFGWTDRIDINTTNTPEQLSPDEIKNRLREQKKERTVE